MALTAAHFSTSIHARFPSSSMGPAPPPSPPSSFTSSTSPSSASSRGAMSMLSPRRASRAMPRASPSSSEPRPSKAAAGSFPSLFAPPPEASSCAREADSAHGASAFVFESVRSSDDAMEANEAVHARHLTLGRTENTSHGELMSGLDEEVVEEDVMGEEMTMVHAFIIDEDLASEEVMASPHNDDSHDSCARLAERSGNGRDMLEEIEIMEDSIPHRTNFSSPRPTRIMAGHFHSDLPEPALDMSFSDADFVRFDPDSLEASRRGNVECADEQSAELS